MPQGARVYPAAKTRNMLANMGGKQASGNSTQVNIINNAGVQTRQEKKRGPNGEEMVNIVLERVKEDMSGGGFDNALGGRFGARPVRVRRGAGA
jgi:hypothetical protein